MSFLYIYIKNYTFLSPFTMKAVFFYVKPLNDLVSSMLGMSLRGASWFYLAGSCQLSCIGDIYLADFLNLFMYNFWESLISFSSMADAS